MSQTNTEVYDLQWRKARRSVGNGACVEVVAAKEQILIRDSQDLDGPIMHYPLRSWHAFLSDAKMGQFDLDYL
jgi:hypothetical protein